MSKKITSPVLYDIIRTPVVTEKSTLLGEYNKVTFKVAKSSTKGDVKRAVEALFNVKVTNVNTLNQDGKIKRFRGKLGVRNSYKKAIVTLAEGNTIDVMGGAN